MRRVRALEPRMARLWDAIKALKAYIAQLCRRKRLSLRRKERIGDSRRIARADEVHQRVPLRPLRGSAYGLGQPDAFGTGAFRGRRFRERRDRADAAEAGAGPRVKVFRTGPCARICGWMRDLTPKEGSLAERGCAEVPPTRHVQPWAVPPPTPNAPLRKEVEREAGDPEGNLVIVERVARKRQHHFSCREYGWVGTAHRFGASTAWTDGTRKMGKLQMEICLDCTV